MKCNREVTWISWKRLCFDKCDGSSSVTDKPSVCLLKSCVEILRSCGLNNQVVVSEIPVF